MSIHRVRTMAWALLVALGVTLGTAALAAAPAYACSCAEQTLQSQYDRADAVFTARLVSRTVDHGPGWFGRSSGDPAHHVFAVDGVLKGEVHAEQGVDSVAEGSSCGLEISGNGPHLVFADRDGSGLAADLCNGTTALTADVRAQVGGLAGRESLPLPGSAGLAPDSPWPGRLVIAGVAVLLLLTAVVLRRRSRRTSSALGPGHWLWG